MMELAFILTLPRDTTVAGVAGVNVTPSTLAAQLAAPRQPLVLVKLVPVVGGIGEMTAGSGMVIACGSSTRAQSGSGRQPSPVTVLPLPATVSAVTLLAVQPPTPLRGVESLPLMTAPPFNPRLPLL